MGEGPKLHAFHQIVAVWGPNKRLLLNQRKGPLAFALVAICRLVTRSFRMQQSGNKRAKKDIWPYMQRFWRGRVHAAPSSRPLLGHSISRGPPVDGPASCRTPAPGPLPGQASCLEG